MRAKGFSRNAWGACTHYAWGCVFMSMCVSVYVCVSMHAHDFKL